MNTKNIFLNITSFLVFCLINISFAQQEPQYTQYMYNPSAINPAFSGFRNCLSGTLIHRSQWIGMEGAPTTQNLSIHSPLKNENIALGFNAINDNLGAASNISFNGDFSYTILSNNSNFTFGIKAGIERLKLNFDKLKLQDYSDIDFTNFNSSVAPQVGIGFMYEMKNFVAGIGVPRLLETKHLKENGNDIYIGKERRTYYTNIGYLFNIAPSILLKTSANSKITTGAPLQLDVSANFWFNEKFTAGLGYRLSTAASLLVGYQITDEFMIGGAYDYDTTKFTKPNSGSAEIIIRYEFVKNSSDKRILNPRIF